MGREVKRVSADFDHPLGEVYPGLQPPEQRDCPAGCHAGLTTDRKYLESAVHLLLVAAESNDRDDMHPWVQQMPLARGVPGPAVKELVLGLTGREDTIFALGFDATARWNATRAVIEAAGFDPDEWGICDTCGGSAIHPDDENKYESWEPDEPPEGDGWQVWETVSAGSPVTPVFETKDALIAHLVEEGTTSDSPFSKKSAETFVEDTWAPTFTVSREGFQTGVEAAGNSRST